VTEQTIYTSHRWNVRWDWRQLGNDDSPQGRLEGAVSGSVEHNVFNTIRGKGNLSWKGQEPLDWTQVRVQPWYYADTAFGPLTWPLGVFICSTPDEAYTSTGVSADVELYDKLLLLDQAAVKETYTVGTGVTVTAIIRTLLIGHTVVMTDSPETLTYPRSWQAGTKLLTIVNELLASINYFSLWCDGYGAFRAEPYVPLAQRGVEYDFEAGEAAIFAPTYTRSRDLFEVPNVVIGFSRADGDALPLTSTAVNDDPRSPTSTVRRGTAEMPFELAVVEENIEATSQAVLDGIVQRMLIEKSSWSTPASWRCSYEWLLRPGAAASAAGGGAP
jgi:hypothetical protein